MNKRIEEIFHRYFNTYKNESVECSKSCVIGAMKEAYLLALSDVESQEYSCGIGYGMRKYEEEIGEIEIEDKITKLKENLKREYGL